MSCIGGRPWWPKQRKKEESERLREDGDKIKFIDVRFARGQVVGFRQRRRSKG